MNLLECIKIKLIVVSIIFIKYYYDKLKSNWVADDDWNKKIIFANPIWLRLNFYPNTLSLKLLKWMTGLDYISNFFLSFSIDLRVTFKLSTCWLRTLFWYFLNELMLDWDFDKNLGWTYEIYSFSHPSSLIFDLST